MTRLESASCPAKLSGISQNSLGACPVLCGKAEEVRGRRAEATRVRGGHGGESVRWRGATTSGERMERGRGEKEVRDKRVEKADGTEESRKRGEMRGE